MERLSIEDMKRIELEIMDELDRICSEHGISYYLGYGSLLGAVRHGGLIPWDDDMDVVMLREDCERFYENFSDWCQVSKYKLASYRDGHSIYQFFKMVDSSTIVLENYADKSYSTGVWIDIFPLDYVDPGNPSSFKKAFNKNKRLGLIRDFIVTDASVGSTPLIKLAKKIVCPFAKKLSPIKYARLLDENAAHAANGKTEYVADIVGEGSTRLVFDVDIFKPVPMRFEDRVYCAPQGFEKFLEVQYGDWQTPPKPSDRLVHVCEAYRL